MDQGLFVFEAKFLGLYLLATAVGVAFHELGHALTGWLLDCHPRIVEIGGGPSILRIRLSSAWLVIRLLPISGMVYLLPRGRDRLRASIAVTAAGPLANVVIGSIALAVLARQDYSIDAFTTTFPWLFAQAWILMFTLWPRTYNKQGVAFVSDGYRLYAYFAHRDRDEYGDMHKAILRNALADGEALPPPSSWFPELVVQAIRRDRLKETWAREDAATEVRKILAHADLPAPERIVAAKFLAELEPGAEDANPPVRASVAAV